jgi:tyrosyl-tRNA synthetase
MIEQGGVRIDGTRIDDKHLIFSVKGAFVLQVGKRKYARISIV